MCIVKIQMTVSLIRNIIECDFNVYLSCKVNYLYAMIKKPNLQKNIHLKYFFHFNDTLPQEKYHLYLFYANGKTNIHLKYFVGFSKTSAQGTYHLHL